MATYEEARVAQELFADNLAKSGKLVGLSVVHEDESYILEAVYDDSKPVDLTEPVTVGSVKVRIRTVNFIPPLDHDSYSRDSDED